MKMRSDHYATLQEYMLGCRKIDQHLDQVLISMEIEPAYSNERIRWEWFYKTRIEGVPAEAWASEHLYPYLKSKHIDTALKKITGLR